MNLTYKITQDMIDVANEFAEKSAITSLDKYHKRNQNSLLKIKSQIKDGKIGEMIAYQHLCKIFPEISKPDLSIFDNFQKSWDPDLYDPSGIRIAVKSQDIVSAINYGESWVFQYRPNKNYDCDFGVFKENNDNHYVAFNALNVPKRFGSIRAIVKIKWLHEKKLFKEMKVHQLRGNKLAVYYDDLLEFENELFQLT